MNPHIGFYFLGILVWIAGYASEKIQQSSSIAKIELVYPPVFFYYLCGAPTSPNKPKGAMSLGAFRAQIFGVCSGLFGVFLNFWKSNLLGFYIGLVLILLTPYVVTYFVIRQSKK